ncbi:flavin-binding monooxygenase [Metarhizium robertsii]|uniref:Flavin-binding monooxygenase n=1 Tax=Metarhizium robertsii TaxID=568076 RepID=A0A014PGI3_9HYPO|nr:flavin-binding monooxygenase [Metarhizium robertsii]
MKVAVIGGGTSGLVTLKYLIQAREYLGCGSVQVYEDAELTTFSDFRRPNEPDFLSAASYVRYLEDYCTHFNLWPDINVKTRVLAVKRRFRGHTVVYETEDGHQAEWDCDAVAVCSGLHVEPNMPEIEGLENVPRVIHSSAFKARKQFHSSKTVMIVGSGETGADISHLAVTTPNAERVILCHKDGCHFAPKRNPGPVILRCLRKPDPREPGIPIDISRANMFDTAYVHKILRRNDKFLWDYYNIYIKCLLFITSGTTLGMDQWIGGISKERDHPSKSGCLLICQSDFFNKSMEVCPYINEPYRSKVPGPSLWLYSLRSFFVQTPIADTRGKRVDLAPLPQCFDEKGTVQFFDNKRPEYDRMQGQRIRPDMVVMCTGCKNRASHFSVRLKTETMLHIRRLIVRISIQQPLLPEDEHHYRLRALPDARINYAVDHESYAYQLALDIGSAPGLADIFKHFSWRHVVVSFKLLTLWVFGAHINTKFRLKGPWKWDGALDIFTSDEIWQTVTRRPIVFGHLAVSIIPMSIFGAYQFSAASIRGIQIIILSCNVVVASTALLGGGASSLRVASNSG